MNKDEIIVELKNHPSYSYCGGTSFWCGDLYTVMDNYVLRQYHDDNYEECEENINFSDFYVKLQKEWDEFHLTLPKDR